MNSGRPPARRWFAILSSLLLLAALGFAFTATRNQQRAAALLVRMDREQPPAIAKWNTCQVDEQSVVLPDGIRANLYQPRDRERAPGMIVLHGVHRLGIEEPRLRKFARSFAESCVQVLTPQIASLADYRIDPQAIGEIGNSTVWFSQRLQRPVGVMGLSFAGGLALLAAADSRFSKATAFVVAVGAHSDLSRVSRFLVTGLAELPAGRTRLSEAEQYGALVLVFAHPEAFFPRKDASKARDCLRQWLAEEYEQARTCEGSLGAASKVMMEALFQHQIEPLRSRLMAEIEREKPTMAAVSPSGRLRAITSPVFLLHGEHDAVIPASETEWLARDVPSTYLREVLISPAVGHVETRNTSLADHWRLVSFLAAVLAELEQTVSARTAKQGTPTSSR